MDDPEIREWLETLDPDPATQLKMVEDLLAHANEDEMSEADRATCARAKEILSHA